MRCFSGSVESGQVLHWTMMLLLALEIHAFVRLCRGASLVPKLGQVQAETAFLPAFQE